MPRMRYFNVLKVFKYRKKFLFRTRRMLYLNKKIYDQATFLVEDFHMSVYCYVKVIFSDIKNRDMKTS